jgi:hypothetical protein
MSTLVIRKKSLKTWEHYLDDRPLFISSKFFFNTPEGFKFQIVEEGKATLGAIAIEDITLYDDSTGGGAETFATVTELSIRLEALDYTGHYRNGDISVGSLISTDVGNDLVLGTDGLLYVVAGSGGGTVWTIVTADITAQYDKYYSIGNNTGIEITSPTPTVARGYVVYSVNGDFLIDGFNFTSNNLVYVFYNGSTWTYNIISSGGGSFDPAVDGVGTIVKVNTPVNSGMTVSEATGNFQGQIDGLKWKAVSVNASYAAENYQNYTRFGSGTTTFTDPTPVASGIGFTVRVVQGSVVVGGVSYGVGYVINRLHLVSWQTKAYFDESIIGSATQAALNLKENASNKALSLASPDHTKYPTTLAVSTAVDSLQGQINGLDLNIGDILAREMLENGTAWFLPALNGITSDARNSLRVNTNPVYFGTISIAALGYSITAYSITGAGQVSGVRVHGGFTLSNRNDVDTIRDFYPPPLPVSSDTRYTVGWSQQFNSADPTNTDQLTHINCIYLCKLSTSDNLHIVHNDDTGTGTSIDLGIDFPANSTLYKYRFFVRKITTSSYLVQVVRTKLSDGAILASSIYSLTTNLPAGAGEFTQIFYIASNTQTGTYFFGDYGLIMKRTPV